MLSIQDLRSDSSLIIEKLKKRGLDVQSSVDEILALDSEYRGIRTELERVQSESNQAASKIGQLMREGKKDEAESIKAKTSEWKQEIKSLQAEVDEKEGRLQAAILTLPNTPHETVPAGKSAEDNTEVLLHGVKPELSDNALPHWELAKKYDIIDFDLGVKVSGAGFPVYKGKGAILQRALIQFFLNEAGKAGYTEIQAPLLVNESSGYGTGQLPDKEGQMYHVGMDDLYLIPTAEVPITNMFRDEMLKEDQLPIKSCGYTPCFRREAGSYGAHVRGLNRLHQFDKVEIVQIVHPDTSYDVLEDMSSYVQSLLQKLGLHYRVLLLCGGDMGFTSAKTYDMEVWSPAQEMWLECSSVSNFENFQTRRLRCRFKGTDKKAQLAHSLNGSALALPRIVAAILESNQTADGIMVPEVLQPYTGFSMID